MFFALIVFAIWKKIKLKTKSYLPSSIGSSLTLISPYSGLRSLRSLSRLSRDLSRLSRFRSLDLERLFRLRSFSLSLSFSLSRSRRESLRS